eukprot:3071534-Rhodomonas_salina.3
MISAGSRPQIPGVIGEGSGPRVVLGQNRIQGRTVADIATGRQFYITSVPDIAGSFMRRQYRTSRRAPVDR